MKNNASKTFNLVKTALVLLCVALNTLSSSSVFAQNEGRWYEVEILIFKRLGSEAYTDETWPENTEFSYPNLYQYLVEREGKNFSVLPRETHKLDAYSYALNRNANYDILFHKAWQQQMQSEDQSPSIIISAGKDINGHKELEGSIKIYIGRFIHVLNDLWLTSSQQKSGRVWSSLPSRPDSSSRKASFRTSSYPVATLRERRRMRSNELHYIDHPLMGMLVIFTPIEEKTN